LGEGDPLAVLAAALLGLSAVDRARLAAILLAGKGQANEAAQGPQAGPECR
jgi:hypothetical protein